jgi:glycosyltransferase involved in cell wall biosynthesis
MEAMSCNLPVVTTKFGALPRLFKEGDGFFFIENEYEILPILEILKKDNQHISTRKKALNYSWEMISKKIEVMYEKALK